MKRANKFPPFDLTAFGGIDPHEESLAILYAKGSVLSIDNLKFITG